MIGIVSRDGSDALMAGRIQAWFAVPVVFSQSLAPLTSLRFQTIFVIPAHALDQKLAIETWIVDHLTHEYA